MASQAEFEALKEKSIHIGDRVSLRIRGGHQEGIVEKIATSTEETPHPPKARPHVTAFTRLFRPPITPEPPKFDSWSILGLDGTRAP